LADTHKIKWNLTFTVNLNKQYASLSRVPPPGHPGPQQSQPKPHAHTNTTNTTNNTNSNTNNSNQTALPEVKLQCFN
jgi:hypothetical protein